MGRRNQPTDVFKKINTHDNDYSVCWEWTGSVGGRKDQPRPYFTVDGTKKMAYRIVYELVKGPIPEKHVIRHTCDNGLCCNPYHLEVGTHEENMKDMRDRERHGLSHYVVRNIRRLGEQGRKHAEIADLYGLSRRQVTDICNKVSYKDVTDTEEEENDDQEPTQEQDAGGDQQDVREVR